MNLSIPRSGMQTAIDRAAVSAAAISNAPMPARSGTSIPPAPDAAAAGTARAGHPAPRPLDADIATSVGALKASRYALSANAAVLRVQDQMAGDVIDLLA
jgi:hypothetical protein